MCALAGVLLSVVAMNFAFPPPYLPAPGRAVILWKKWQRMFDNSVLASGADTDSPECRRALLVHCLGIEGQRILYTLSEDTPTEASEPSTSKAATAFMPDVYDATLADLEAHFTSINVVVE